MKITYVKHSCFAVELSKEHLDTKSDAEDKKQIVYLFDYFQGEIPVFSKDSYIYVFVSHKHADHYSQEIFQLADQYENIVFVLAKEIRMNEKYMNRCQIPLKARGKMIYVHANQEYDLACGGSDDKMMTVIHVKTYKSTDSGVAYLVQYAGKNIYHAGDLNWWKMQRDEAVNISEPELEKLKDSDIRMEQNFKKEIALLAEEVKIDVAFLPLDGRLERFAGLGFSYYMKNCNIKKAFPMHMWEEYSLVRKYSDSREAVEFADRIVEIHRLGEQFLL